MRITKFVAVGTVAALVVAGCGGDDDSADTTSAPTPAETTAAPASQASSTAASTEASDALQALLFTEPEFPYPDTPVELGARKVAVIASGRGPSGMENWATVWDQALQEVGWTASTASDGQFNPAVQATLVQQAVLDEVDAIILLSVIPSSIPEAINAAKAAGIPIVCNLCLPDVTEGIIHVGAKPETMGEIEGRLVAATIGKPDAKLVMVRADEVPVLITQAETIKATLAELCPGCTIEEVNVLLADLALPAIPALANILQSHAEGEIDGVLMPFSALAENMLQIAKQQGRDDFKMYSISGTTPWAEYVAAGTDLPVAFGDLSYSRWWEAYAAIDLAARAINGDQLWDATTGVPGMPFTAENADQVLDAEGNWTPAGAKEKFHELWGLG